MKSMMLAFVLTLATAAGALADVCAPAGVTDLHQDDTGYHTYVMEWTRTGDDGFTGNAASWEIRSSISVITDTNWQNAPVLSSSPSNTCSPQDCASYTAKSCPDTLRYYVVFLFDAAGNRSPMSNVATGRAPCSGPFIEFECYNPPFCY